MKAHAKLSASGSHRWINCPGSVKAEEGLPDTRSHFADEGTAAHELAEHVLINYPHLFAFQYEGLKHPTHDALTVSYEMCAAVQAYVDYVLTVSKNCDLDQEVRLDFSDWVPEGFGTSDALAFDGTTVHVIDFKYGKGVMVDAYQNTQAILYALGALKRFDFYDPEYFHVHIVQPRIDHISEWRITRDELLALGEWIKNAANEALKPDAPRIPGEKQCQFCKAKATCPALAKHTENVLMSSFDDLTLQNPDKLTNEQLRKAMDAKKLIVSWLDAVEDHISLIINESGTFPGYKLVEGRSLRQWSNDAEAEKRLVSLLGNDAFERKVLSVAKAEKALGKKRISDISDLIEKPKGKPTLAPESDSRPSIFNITLQFDTL